MERVKVGVSIIYEPNFYILHQRTPENDTGEEDKIGLYGGRFDHRHDKSLAETARRELGEESGVWFAPESFDFRNPPILVISEREGGKIQVEAHIFWVNLKYGAANGNFDNSVFMTSEELIRAKTLGRLTTVASAALTNVLRFNNGHIYN